MVKQMPKAKTISESISPRHKFLTPHSPFSCYEKDPWNEIAKHLDGKSLVKLAATCRWFYQVMMEESIWKFACLRDLQLPDTQVVASKWINLYASAFISDESNSQVGDCLISYGNHPCMFCQPEEQIGFSQIGVSGSNIPSCSYLKAWKEIANYLDGESLVKLAATCRWFYQVMKEECICKFACLRDLQVPDTQVVASKWINLYASALDESNSYMFHQPEEQVGDCLISNGSQSYMLCQPEKEIVFGPPRIFCTPSWEAMDFHRTIRAGVSENYLVIKAFSNSTLEVFNMRTEERTIVVEYEDTPLLGYALLAYNLDGWLLLNKDTKTYYYNVVTRGVIRLPDLAIPIGPLAEGGFSTSPEDEANVTIILRLYFVRAVIAEYRPTRGWFLYNIIAHTDTTLIDCLRVMPARLFWLANGLIFCCSSTGVEWSIQIEQEGEADLHWVYNSLVEQNGSLYLLRVHQDMTAVALFKINDEGDGGNLEELQDFMGTIHTVRTTGGIIFPGDHLKLFGAGSLWDFVESFEISNDGSRVRKRCQFEGIEEMCLCAFGWIHLDPRR